MEKINKNKRLRDARLCQLMGRRAEIETTIAYHQARHAETNMEIEALWADISAAADHTVLHALREQIHDIADRLPPEMEG